ncbi:hypothetical protein KSP39_PZI011436 [Platanthera zijinensis]|uniref:Uncharacterized protein n=1 Tax=Platanthera zijinensis TaxID=2320716 RepID=A0AAP0BGJ8_9ASPA
MHEKASLFGNSRTRTGETLTQGFLADSVRRALTFASEYRKQQNMSSSYDWSDLTEKWRKCRKFDEYRPNSCTRGSLVEEENYQCTDIAEISKVCFDSSTTINTHSSSSPVKDGFVYKRRKMQRNTFVLLSGENSAEVTDKNNLFDFNLSFSEYHLLLQEDSSDDVQEAVENLSRDCQINENPSFSGRNLLDVHTTSKSQLFDHKNLDSVPTYVKKEQSFVTEVSHSAEGCTNEPCSSSTGNCNVINDTSAMSKKYVPSASILTVAGEHSGECSNSNAIALKNLEMFESPEELCVYVLKRHGLLGENSRNNDCVAPENMGSGGPVFSSCKICGIPENVLKMLICDDCEDAFHLSCCRPKIKKLPRDEWYCQSCFMKKPKPLLRKNTQKSSDISDDTFDTDGPISSMLRGNRPHRSRARVGEDFQVEIPDSSDPISNDDYFSKAKEMDHVDYCSLEGWNWSKPSKSSSIGNWLQCKDEYDNGNICGKWRRAPLFSVQTDDWDCSCALPWDPIHADCSVPQEIDTEEVLKHLKFVDMVKSRLNNRTKPF